MKSNGFEIERRFLIKYPDGDILSLCYDVSDIVQTYLKSENGVTERVRMRASADTCVYTHTLKRKVNDIRRYEDEREISAEEYQKLLLNADPGRKTIFKKRCCIEYDGKIFEIDLFSFWNDRAIMEVELIDETESVTLPPEIDVIREISGDKRYTNAALAKEIPYEEI